MSKEHVPGPRVSIGRSLGWIAILAVLMAPIFWWLRDGRMIQMRTEVARQESLAQRARAEAELNLARATMAIRETIGDASVASDKRELDRLRAENGELKRKLAEVEAMGKGRP